jgi:hypothetical protein
MERQFVKQSTEKLARNLGFNWCVVPPSQDYLHEWLRKEHHMFIKLEPYKTKDDTVGWSARVFSLTHYDLSLHTFHYISQLQFGADYEEAYENGLLKALDLIQRKE